MTHLRWLMSVFWAPVCFRIQHESGNLCSTKLRPASMRGLGRQACARSPGVLVAKHFWSKQPSADAAHSKQSIADGHIP